MNNTLVMPDTIGIGTRNSIPRPTKARRNQFQPRAEAMVW